jgi:hypothetical protein
MWHVSSPDARMNKRLQICREIGGAVRKLRIDDESRCAHDYERPDAPELPTPMPLGGNRNEHPAYIIANRIIANPSPMAPMAA